MNEDVVLVARQVADQLAAALGKRLVAFYLYGSAVTPRYMPEQSDINLLAVTQNPADIDDLRDVSRIRDAFRPLWTTLGETLRRPPAVATAAQFQRHLQLQPLLHHHLATFGKLLHGRDLLPPAPAVSHVESFAYWCQQALEISPLLAPALLQNEDALLLNERLRRLARRLGCPAGEDESATAVFAHIQTALQDGLLSLDAPFAWRDQPTAAAPPLLANLQAIYEVEDGALLILPQLSEAEWAAIDWAAVAELLAGQYRRVWAATAAQFRLAVGVERPLDALLRRFNHIWGHDILADLPLAPRLMFRQAARLPSDILINSLPQTYLSQSDDEAHGLIHDFQNKLLNIQLQHELLVRLQGVSPAAPPEPLPDKERPSPERIGAIFAHLDYWAGHYAGLMNQAA